MSLTFCFAGRRPNIDTTRGTVRERKAHTTSYRLQLGDGSHSHGRVCVCDDLQCWPPPSGLAPVSLNVPLSSTVGNSDVSLDLLWHNRDLAQATERLNWSHKSSNPPKVYQDPQSGSSWLSDHTRTPWRLLRTQARRVGASSADIGCGNGPVAPAGSTWSCACSSDPPVVSLLNQKAI